LDEVQAFSKEEQTVIHFAAIMGTPFGQSFLFALLPPTLRRKTNLTTVFLELVERGYLRIHTCYMENDVTFSMRNKCIAGLTPTLTLTLIRTRTLILILILTLNLTLALTLALTLNPHPTPISQILFVITSSKAG
jgi:hypothetical protein